MSGSVIVAGARTPIGRLLGGLKDLSGRRPRRRRHQGRPGEGRRLRRPGRVRDHGPGHPGRRRPDPRPPGRASRAASRWPSRRSRSTRSACPGIDAIAMADQLIRAGEFEIVVAGGMESMTQAPHLLPKSREGFKYGDVEAGRLDGLRRALRPASPTRPMGELDRAAATPRRAADPRGAGRVLRPLAPARRRGVEERPVRRRDRPGRDPAAQGRPDRRSARTRASAATPPPSRWPSCARRSPRTARSPPARPRRSPTAPAPSS